MNGRERTWRKAQNTKRLDGLSNCLSSLTNQSIDTSDFHTKNCFEVIGALQKNAKAFGLQRTSKGIFEERLVKKYRLAY